LAFLPFDNVCGLSSFDIPRIYRTSLIGTKIEAGTCFDRFHNRTESVCS
jgi:hypothetical protein